MVNTQTIYYMPFYFQTALEQSPLASGVSYMSLAIPQMIGLFLGGGVTTATGHYVRQSFSSLHLLTAAIRCP